jgi:hypothetical protein
MRNIRDLAADDITAVVALAADPVLVVLCLGLFRPGLACVGVFESYSYIVEVFEHCWRQWHVQFSHSATED